MFTLSNILKINAISSGITGLLLTVVPSFFSDIFAVSSGAPFFAVGIFLVVFALFVFAVSTGYPVNRSLVNLIIALDVLWGAASVVTIMMAYSAVSVLGILVIGFVAAWVALMAYLQYTSSKDRLVQTI